MSIKGANADLVIVANRLPVDRVTNPDGSVGWRRSPGGLVAAIEPVMRANDGAWIGWPGATDGDLEPFVEDGLSLVPVSLSAQEVEEFYEGFANGTLWPLYHDLVAKPEFHREWWDSYVTVNQRFAQKAAEIAAEGAMVWVQDYQMQLVPAMLRELRPDLRIGFFLHIPFPPGELFQQLPWRRQILEGLLGADLVGFQLPAAAQNFVRLVRQRVGHKTHRDLVYLPNGRTVQAAAAPDLDRLLPASRSSRAPRASPSGRWRSAAPGQPAQGLPRHRPARLHQGHRRAAARLQRADRGGGAHSRGRGLRPGGDAFTRARQPVPHPARRHRPARRPGSTATWAGSVVPPISYLHSSYPREEMAALYRAADIMVVTPFRDGMNLVAKEYVACRYEDDGALVLSEFAGAADELKQAFLINPYDINGMKSALLEAHGADPKDLTKRMRSMRKTVAEHDVVSWANGFLKELAAARPTHAKQVREATRRKQG